MLATDLHPSIHPLIVGLVCVLPISNGTNPAKRFGAFTLLFRRGCFSAPLLADCLLGALTFFCCHRIGSLKYELNERAGE